MKRFTCLAIAIVAAFAFGATEVQAQYGSCGGGFGFQNYGYNFNHSGFERPPYFALFPPVHYSDQIVRRPMGISPFAAPAGVIPAEMKIQVKADPGLIQNPYFKRQDKPVVSGKLDSKT